MQKYLLLLSLLLAASSDALHAQLGQEKFVVQVAAFDRPVEMDYFRGLSGLFETVDNYGIYRYYLGGHATREAAEASRQAAIKAGYNNALVVDMDAVRASCNAVCAFDPKVTRKMPFEDLRALRAIFFDFDRSDLRPASIEQLNLLYKLLSSYPEYTAELRAHTDGRGSYEYNDALSVRRANAARNYLIGRGIAASRIKTSTFGERAPIARNELPDGSDTEEGRQYNRRVEILVLDSYNTILNQLVEEIKVPEPLIPK